jgi:hypothetical protein
MIGADGQNCDDGIQRGDKVGGVLEHFINNRISTLDQPDITATMWTNVGRNWRMGIVA